MSSIASFSSLIAAAIVLRPTGPPPNLSMIVRSSLRSISSKPCSSTSSSFRPACGDVERDRAVRAHLRVVADAAQQPVGDARRAARPPGDLGRGGVVDRHVENPRRAADDLLEIRRRVELQPVDDAEARSQRRGQQARPRRRADEREALEPHLHRPRARPLADDDVDLVVLERRIEDLLDRRRHPVDLVDEQHFARREVGDDADQIARLLDRRPRRRPHLHAHLVARSRRRASSCRAPAGRAGARDRAARRAASPPRSRPAGSRGCGPGRCTRRAARGRSPASYCASSSTRAAVTMRSSVTWPVPATPASASARSCRRADPSALTAASTAFSASGR